MALADFVPAPNEGTRKPRVSEPGGVRSHVETVRFVPAPRRETTSEGKRNSDSGTTRMGGCETGEIPLTLLASLNYVGQTISTRPTLAWFVPDSQSFNLEFRLYEYGLDSELKQVGNEILLKSSPGIMKLSPIEPETPGLSVGKKYLWQVTIICNPNDPSQDLLATAEFRVVDRQLIYSRNLEDLTTLEKVDLYAQEGLWYDALSEALKLSKESKLGEVGSALLESLAKWEEPEATQQVTSQQREEIEHHIQHLRQIAISEQ
ncbi:MAG: DUF928 domain-containing protein [Symploca sp. SIO1C4]|uniref:DUF928 domain-containing protein n=1 Tax=Symploca sp. SIO1C4 TaxID=2607765 RepID=A0A6B3NNG4_9CYAN|nr:DUF928 domain-containing protein [Symploca sp. SIO1C4]NET08308.1 DUF928 domain-containing protein [Symploca sp. SIO2B6]